MEPKVVTLDKFKPRPYQLPLMRALEIDGYKRLLAIMPRRARQRYYCMEYDGTPSITTHRRLLVYTAKLCNG